MVESDAVAAVAIGVKRRQGEDGQWGCNEARVRRESTRGDGRWRGRASDPAELGEAEILWSPFCSAVDRGKGLQ